MMLCVIVPLWALLSLTQQASNISWTIFIGLKVKIKQNSSFFLIPLHLFLNFRHLRKTSVSVSWRTQRSYSLTTNSAQRRTVRRNATVTSAHSRYLLVFYSRTDREDRGLNLFSLQTLELESLLLGLERRLPQLQEDISILEGENDGQLYGAISLQVVENELTEIKQLLQRLNSTTLRHQRLTADTAERVKTDSGKHQLCRWCNSSRRLWARLDFICVFISKILISGVIQTFCVTHSTLQQTPTGNETECTQTQKTIEWNHENAWPKLLTTICKHLIKSQPESYI